MQIRDLQFSGYFESHDASTAEQLQVVVPENELERDLLSWTLLAGPQTIEGDPARHGYAFHYELGQELDRGVFALKVSGRDASGIDRAVEIAAALVALAPTGSQRRVDFTPLWLLSESVHFRPIHRISHKQYHAPAYGHLRFAASANLPHRRLFGATI